MTQLTVSRSEEGLAQYDERTTHPDACDVGWMMDGRGVENGGCMCIVILILCPGGSLRSGILTWMARTVLCSQ